MVAASCCSRSRASTTARRPRRWSVRAAWCAPPTCRRRRRTSSTTTRWSASASRPRAASPSAGSRRPSPPGATTCGWCAASAASTGSRAAPRSCPRAPEPVAAAERPRRILLSPRGVPVADERARALACERALLLICPRYEGVDERVTAYVDEELSIGAYVLTGGEIAALVVMDAVVRLLPGAVGYQVSPSQDSHAGGLLAHPQYTRPEEFRGARVPEVLLRGDHAAIAHWRREESLRATLARRPDLLARAPLSDGDRAILRRLGWRDG